MKQSLRRKFRQIRDELPKQVRYNANASISAKLDTLIQTASCIASYDAINSEVSVNLHGHYALPAIVGDILEFRIWDPATKLVVGKFCKEPGQSPCVIPNVIIIPCLSFDRSCHRLGYGKGFYDRTLALEEYKNSLKIGVAYSMQECEEIPSDSHDIPMDIIITELEIIHAKD